MNATTARLGSIRISGQPRAAAKIVQQVNTNCTLDRLIATIVPKDFTKTAINKVHVHNAHLDSIKMLTSKQAAKSAASVSTNKPMRARGATTAHLEIIRTRYKRLTAKCAQ
jgi:hypothetical protein